MKIKLRSGDAAGGPAGAERNRQDGPEEQNGTMDVIELKKNTRRDAGAPQDEPVGGDRACGNGKQRSQQIPCI